MRPPAPVPVPPDLSRSHPIRGRLWKAAFAHLLLIVTFTVGSHAANPRTSPLASATGEDFLPSYMAGTFVRQGRTGLLMNYPEAARFQARLRQAEGLAQHGRTGPWLNPPSTHGCSPRCQPSRTMRPCGPGS